MFDNIWQAWTSFDKFELLWTSSIHFEQVWTSLVNVSPIPYKFEAFWKSLNWFENLFGQVESNLEMFEPIWAFSIQFGQVWTYLDSFEPIWTCLNQLGQIWRNLGMFDFDCNPLKRQQRPLKRQSALILRQLPRQKSTPRPSHLKLN